MGYDGRGPARSPLAARPPSVPVAHPRQPTLSSSTRREHHHLMSSDVAYPEALAKWQALTGPLDPAAEAWAERTFGDTTEVQQAS